MANWMVHTKKADFKAIGEKYHIDQVIARVIRNRGIAEPEEFDQYINGTKTQMYDGFLMKDMKKAVDLILDKICGKKKIRIIGDYDIDGVSSTYILIRGLRALGADVDYVIPHRVTDGYGINEHLIQLAHEDAVDTIITCDNGIAAMEQIQYAKELGMTVVVTDHHDIRFTENENGCKIFQIPPADAVVNPKQMDCEYPFKEICGAVVAYKFVECLLKTAGMAEEKREDLLDILLEMAATATVGDIMSLVDENRIIVKEGLVRLNHSRILGMRALMEVNAIDPGEMTAYTIGFVVGPCLNASGRLDTAELSLKLLLAEDVTEAALLAGKLKELNEERKNLTEEQVLQAIDRIETSELAKDNVLVVYLPDCHESIAGIIAGRLRDRYYKPTLVLTKAEDGLKGSGRSIEAYNMFEHLLEVGHLMTKFGGHPMAAGVSLLQDNLEEFRKQLNQKAHLSQEDLTPVVWIDVPMPIDYISEQLIEQLSVLEPFGKGNAKPVFADKNLSVRKSMMVGKNKNIRKLELQSPGGTVMEAMQYRVVLGQDIPINVGDMISVIYYPTINEFNGQRKIQIVIEDVRK